MSLAPELAAFIGRPPAALPVATRAHRLDGDIAEENPMPTGVYTRKKKAAKAVEKPEAKAAEKPAKVRKPRAKARAKAAPKARAKAATGPRFGVFEDGTVELRLASCKGTIGPEDARDLNAFITRLQAK